MNLINQIEEEIKNMNIDIEIYEIQDYEFGEYIENSDKYHKLYIKVNDEVFSVLLCDLDEAYINSYGQNLNKLLGNNEEVFYKIDVFTGFWMKCDNELNNEILDKIKELTLIYYLISKYDKIVYLRKGFDIFKYLSKKGLIYDD